MPTGTRPRPWWGLEHLQPTRKTLRPNRGHGEICDTFLDIVLDMNGVQGHDIPHEAWKNSGKLMIPLTLIIDHFGFVSILTGMKGYATTHCHKAVDRLCLTIVSISPISWMRPVWTRSVLSWGAAMLHLHAQGLSVREMGCRLAATYVLSIADEHWMMCRPYQDYTDAEPHAWSPVRPPDEIMAHRDYLMSVTNHHDAYLEWMILYPPVLMPCEFFSHHLMYRTDDQMLGYTNSPSPMPYSDLYFEHGLTDGQTKNLTIGSTKRWGHTRFLWIDSTYRWGHTRSLRVDPTGSHPLMPCKYFLHHLMYQADDQMPGYTNPSSPMPYSDQPISKGSVRNTIAHPFIATLVRRRNIKRPMGKSMLSRRLDRYGGAATLVFLFAPFTADDDDDDDKKVDKNETKNTKKLNPNPDMAIKKDVKPDIRLNVKLDVKLDIIQCLFAHFTRTFYLLAHFIRFLSGHALWRRSADDDDGKEGDKNWI